MKRLIESTVVVLVISLVLVCYGCGPSAAITAGILTHGNSRAMRDAFIAGTAVDLTAANVALNRAAMARAEQPPEQAEVVEPEQPPEQEVLH